jgi:membrane protein implicated in regulation of membrane protease activity
VYGSAGKATLGASLLVLILLCILGPSSSAMGAQAASAEADATVRAVDALFGWPVGGAVVISSSRGEERRYDLEDGRARITVDSSDQPHRVTFDGQGISRAQAFSPAAGERALLRVVTYLDVATLILLHMAAVVAFLVARGTSIQNRRTSSRESVTGPGLAGRFGRVARKPKHEDQSLVRVRLASGRVVEGWMEPSPPGPEEEEEVLRLRPVGAFDTTGRSDAPTPLDSFIPSASVASIETLDESHDTAALDPPEGPQERVIDVREQEQAES